MTTLSARIPEPAAFTFSQIHIEAARNSTDDFNLFHDKNKWQRIEGNPFGGPIVLGFQLECLIEYQMRCYRESHHEESLIRENHLQFSNYQFTFANVVRPGEPISVEIRKSQVKNGHSHILANRVLVKNGEHVVLLGYKKESDVPLVLSDAEMSWLPDLAALPDRSYFANDTFFLKRKYMNVGNAKNFLSGSLAEQSDYFDELEGKINFPETFPVSLTSCALLERAFKEHHDFERNPMVYTTHNITVDKTLLQTLKSNDVLYLLVKRPQMIEAEKGLGRSSVSQHVSQCFGVLEDKSVLFRAEIAMTPLKEILAAAAHTQ